MRVLVLTPYPYGTTAGPRSSFELWERVLADAGITLDYAPFETDELHAVLQTPGAAAAKARGMASSYARSVRRLPVVEEYDAVLVNREAALIGPALMERWVARRRPLIYLIDDPLYVPYRSAVNGYLSYLKFFGKVRSLCRMSTTVIVNSSHHEEFARRHNDNVWQIPSVVDGELYRPRPRRPGDGVTRIGWTGSPSTAPNLQVIREPLRRLAARDDVEIRLVGAPDFGLPDVPHVGKPWSAATEVDDVAAFDIGLLPLPTDPWTRRKFYLKLVQYMALGIPAVATPLGANPVVLEHGRTGYLAEGDEQWHQSLATLAEQPELRAEMGAAAAEKAHRRYTLQANAERVVAAFRSAVAPPPR